MLNYNFLKSFCSSRIWEVTCTEHTNMALALHKRIPIHEKWKNLAIDTSKKICTGTWKSSAVKITWTDPIRKWLEVRDCLTVINNNHEFKSAFKISFLSLSLNHISFDFFFKRVLLTRINFSAFSTRSGI